jgi:glycosyltransferase involved in cell wall biosynthesis
MVAGMYDKHIKGIDILIPILKRLKDEGMNIAMHFVGDGDYRAFFEDLAKDNDVSDICIFHGWKSRNEVLSIVSQMDFLISASRYESFGCSMAEAAMMGTPVLATDSGGSRSIVNSDNGNLITEYSEEAIFNGIKDMVNSFKSFDSESFAKAAREKFSISSEAARYMDVYSRLMLRSR